MAKSNDEDDLGWLDGPSEKPKREKKRVSGVIGRLKKAKATATEAEPVLEIAQPVEAEDSEPETAPVASEIECDTDYETTPAACKAKAANEPTPSQEVNYEEFDEIEELDDTLPIAAMEPEPADTPSESTKRGDAVPVPSPNPTADAVNRKRDLAPPSEKPTDDNFSESDVEDEDEEEEQPSKFLSGNGTSGKLAASQEDSGDDDDGSPDEDGKSSSKNYSVNPISASVRDASVQKASAIARAEAAAKGGFTGPIFIVDPVSDRWIAEDMAEAESGKTTRHRKRGVNARAKRKRGFWGVISTLVFLGVLCLLILGAAVWFSRGYLMNRGETLAIEKLENEGLYLNYEGPIYKFPRGLIFSDVTIFETKERQTPLLKVANLGVNLDAWHLLSKHSADGLEAVITMKDATAIAFHEGNEICKITEINADLFATPERLKINRLRGTLNGLDFDVEGLANLPEPVESADATAETPPAADSEKNGPILDFGFLKDALEPIAFEKMEDGDNPRIDLNIDLGSDLSLVATGRFSGRDFKWQGIPLDLVGVTFDYSQKLDVIDIIDAQIGYGGNSINAKAQMLLGKNRLENLNITSNANLVELVSHFAPEIEDKLAGIQMRDNPTIGATGSLDLNEPLASTITIDYQHWKGFTVKVDDIVLPIRGINGQLILNNNEVSVSKTSPLRATVLDGEVVMNINSFKLNDPTLPFRGVIEISQLPVNKAAFFITGQSSELTGLFSGTFRGKGAIHDLTQLNGSGDLKIDGGKLYKMPVIGPIQKLLATVIPIFGNRELSALTAKFDAMSGIIITNDLLIRSDGTKVKVSGSVDLTKQTTKFNAKANLDGPLGLATGLAAEMLTIEGSGTISEPNIRLAGVPEGLPGLAGEGLEAVGNLLGGGNKKPDEGAAAPVPAAAGETTAPAPVPAPAPALAPSTGPPNSAPAQ